MKFWENPTFPIVLRWASISFICLVLLFYLLYLLTGIWLIAETLEEILPKFLERNEMIERIREEFFPK